MTEQSPLTVADIEAGLTNPEWNGWGYLGERSRTEDTDQIVAADEVLLSLVNAEGWTAAEFFAWLDSKLGRWFGDLAFGNDVSADEVRSKSAAWELIAKVVV